MQNGQWKMENDKWKMNRSDFALVAAYLLESRLCVENQ